MKPVLRPYQTDLIDRILYQWATKDRVLAQLPTGGGKSVIFGSIASTFAAAGWRVLLMAHREELIFQALTHLSNWCEGEIGIIKAGYPDTPGANVQVASVQSLVNRLDRVGEFDLIIIDEAHHTTASSYRTILDRYPSARILGLTATPIRLDGTGFDDLFDVLECGITTAELIRLGYLSPFKMYADMNPMSIAGVRSFGGDYSISALDRQNDKVEIAGHLVNAYRRYAPGLRAVIFALNINHSDTIELTFQANGIPAAHLDGESDPQYRKLTLDRFKRGEIQVLSNVGLFDEGVDIPALECVMIARPTKSLSRYLQMCGRVLRIAEGKPHGTIVDLAENWTRHGLPDLFHDWKLEGTDSIAQRLTISSDRELKLDLIPKPQPLPVDKELKLLTSQNIDPELIDRYRKLWEVQQKEGYQKGWLFYRLRELNPPLAIWQAYGKRMGYHHGWAKHTFKNMQLEKGKRVF